MNDQLSLQAQGTVRIVNSYSNPIALIKSTRLLAPDGKLFRLAQAVNIPANGEVTANVYADQNGSLYAIGPASFTVPGLSSVLQSYITVTSYTSFALATPLAVATLTPAVSAPVPVSQPTPVQQAPAPVQ